MQYFSKGNPENLRQAVECYREYLQKEPSGPRKGEVQEALEKLVPQLEKLGAEVPPVAAETNKPKKPHVMVSSQTPGARVSFDGRNVGDYFAAEVEPGKHKFTVAATGYFEESRRSR